MLLACPNSSLNQGFEAIAKDPTHAKHTELYLIEPLGRLVASQ
jgi:hypothetical protein